MTSNAGSDHKGNAPGYTINEAKASEDKVKAALKEYFRPEFINRIDEIIPFSHLSLDDLAGITYIKIQGIIKRLEGFSIDLTISESVINYIAKQALKKNLGARPIDRIIARDIEAPIARLLSEKKLTGIQKVRFDLENEKIALIKLCPQLQD